MEYKRRLKMRASKADKRPLTVDGPQVNGRSRECEGCPATSFMVRDLEQAETEILKLVQANYFDKEIKILKDFQTQTGSVPKDLRSVTVQTGTGSVLDRPVNKLVLLLESPKDRPGIPDEEPEEL
ncbi:unnamed protein product [Porites lobata]|uniref:Uncharacterized protein n=1 Tax=Porites lobata TaxID=104759 RepID=A0ABN8NX99_9CNID|nr:unnamed protein product [Porites lobata]